MRQETDRFGTITMPSGCLYGIQTARCIENLSFSKSYLKDYPQLLKALLQVKTACARANSAAGVVTAELGRAIENACGDAMKEEYRSQFAVDMLHGGGGIAFNVNVNEVIANIANISAGGQAGAYEPVHPKEHVNASQSTADVCHTALRLALRESSAGLIVELRTLKDALAGRKLALGQVITVARTCLQDAMPVSLGEMFGAFAALIKRLADELEACREILGAVNLGGTVIGSGEGAPEAYRKMRH